MGKQSRRQKRNMPKMVKEQPVNYKRIDGEPQGNFETGWSSWEDCLAYCRQQYPEIPIDMIELGMSYCERHPDTKEKWESIPAVNLPLSGKMRRKLEKDGTLEEFLSKKKAHEEEIQKKSVIDNAVKIYEKAEDAPVFPLGKGVAEAEGKLADCVSGEGFLHKGHIWTPNQDGYIAAKELYEKEQNKISTKCINE